MSWDGFQRGAIAELGYRLYRQVDAAQPVAVDADVAPAPQAGAQRSSLHPLQLALLRAAGRAASDPEAARLCGEWPAPESLRAPAAKRALWPRLRAVRARTR
ncbi:hypothetical protein E4582_12050 [Luteimonas yindakuii]|uniref:Uncharacterized protein n=1 Tax=Luteimonas yindakuii TaxID=2565782 RepID=A0A4Z1RE34_9GAMM|nr:hypothetical protein [Luteimonas yindakuii]QCO66933.1 hypothetical protein E5843_02430 [Luteimonas yindakuii]TKS52937.1 hypothetical protein E4582_12050 [Luteimonas yindakuii]